MSRVGYYYSADGSLSARDRIHLNHEPQVEQVNRVEGFEVNREPPSAGGRVLFDRLIDNRDVIDPRGAQRNAVVGIPGATLPNNRRQCRAKLGPEHHCKELELWLGEADSCRQNAHVQASLTGGEALVAAAKAAETKNKSTRQ
jgi:hypothetical protein